MKIARDLQVVTGQTGRTIETSDLAAKKTIIATNILGTIHIEASADGVNFFAVAAMNPSNLEQPIFLVTPHMRVVAASGAASSVIVVAEEGLVRAAVVPSPPLYGRGASIDISHFGTLTTLYVGTDAAAFPRWAAVKVQVSADNVHWVTFDSFHTSACTTREMSACFVRGVGSGATGSIALASEEPGARAHAQTLAFVFRARGVAGGNVSTAWSNLVASRSSVQGRKIFQFDDCINSPCIIDAGVWRVKDVTWAGYAPRSRGSLAGLRRFFPPYRGHAEECLHRFLGSAGLGRMWPPRTNRPPVT